MNSSDEYRVLVSEDDLHANYEKPPLDSVNKNQSLYHRVTLWLSVFLTFVNLGVLVISSRWNSATHNLHLDRKNIHTLRRPSQYIGFDSIERPVPPIPKNFTNYPFLLTQVDFAHPDRVLPESSKKSLAHSGTIYPDDKKLLVADKITTIAQFRAIDYGMEDCEIHINLPPASQSTQTLEAVSLYRLEADMPLDVGKLSSRTSPRRIGKLADIYAVQGEPTTWRRRVFCGLEEVLTFEVACPDDLPHDKSCQLEWWQTKRESTPGFYLIQHATI